MTSSEIKIPAEPTYSSLLETFVADAARRAELSDEQGKALVDAASTAFATILERAMDEEREPLRIAATCTPNDLRLSIFERGLPLDDAYAARDRRWAEIAAGVDEAHWHPHGRSGCELRLVTHLPHGNSDSRPQPQAAVALAPPQEYEIRRFRNADAPGVARAFYLTYGYHYIVPAVYVPERLCELNDRNLYVSVVAVTGDGEVAAHAALGRSDEREPVADFCGAIVLPAHRGRNLLAQLAEQAEREAVALGLEGYYGEPVTDHPRTQLAVVALGAKTCGITLGMYPRDFLARHMELSTTTQRQSVTLCFKALRSPQPRTVYAPPRHRDMVRRIYDELQLPIELHDGTKSVDRGAFRTKIVRNNRNAFLTVERAGTHLAGHLRQVVDDLRALEHIEAIFASLPLDDPGTPALCETMESLGLFFSGIGPWMLDGRDALRLQMPLTPIDVAKLVLVDNFSKELLQYIGEARESA